MKLASKIQLNIIKNNEEIPDLNLSFRTKSENTNLWLQLLKYFQEEANLEIKIMSTIHLRTSFNQLKLFEYKIEDIEFLN